MIHYIRRAISGVESALDRVKLGYKRKYDRWHDLQIEAYRGYGTPVCLHVKGRVLDDKGATADAEHDSRWESIKNTWRRVETDEIPGAVVQVTIENRTIVVETDEDGFFELSVDVNGLDGEGPWHAFPVELLEPASPDGRDVTADADVIVPHDDCEFGVVSDLDDTVIHTGATNRLRMVRTVLLNTARTRSPFPGVAAFYRALTLGPDGQGHNPMFYVSSSPWNLYDMFATFMEARDLPAGPIFLKDFGFTEDKFLNTGHAEHKLERIGRLLTTYPELPFVLVGDSGQKDAEIYSEIIRQHPDRIRAAYIRDVTSDERDGEIDGIAEELASLGVPMVRTEHTHDAARHAASEGLISEDWVDEVRRSQ